MIVKIKDAEVELKNTFRSMIIYEAIAEKPFKPNGISEFIIYFYSVVLASKKDVEITFDEFMDWVDENPNSIAEFTEWFMKVDEVNSQFNNSSTQKKRTARTKTKK